jgi:hypothetical protein
MFSLFTPFCRCGIIMVVGRHSPELSHPRYCQQMIPGVCLWRLRRRCSLMMMLMIYRGGSLPNLCNLATAADAYPTHLPQASPTDEAFDIFVSLLNVSLVWPDDDGRAAFPQIIATSPLRRMPSRWLCSSWPATRACAASSMDASTHPSPPVALLARA